MRFYLLHLVLSQRQHFTLGRAVSHGRPLMQRLQLRMKVHGALLARRQVAVRWRGFHHFAQLVHEAGSRRCVRVEAARASLLARHGITLATLRSEDHRGTLSQLEGALDLVKGRDIGE